MKAAILTQQDMVPVFGDFPDPVLQENEKLIYMKAASIKNIDKMMAGRSHYHQYAQYPTVVGVDGVGILEDGTRVYSGSKKGMMSEKVAVNKYWMIKLPDELDNVTAAALPNPAVSAWLSLEWKGQLKKDDAVLILGATGITGSIAVQLAKHLGAGRVVAMGRNEKALANLISLGADKTISINQSPEQIKKEIKKEKDKQPFTIVLDYLWGEPAEIVLDALTGHDLEAEGHLTRWIQIGEMAGSAIKLNAAPLRSSGIEMCGQGGGSIPAEITAKIPSVILPEIFKLAIEGKLKIETKTYNLNDIEAAWKDNCGKRIVIEI